MSHYLWRNNIKLPIYHISRRRLKHAARVCSLFLDQNHFGLFLHRTPLFCIHFEHFFFTSHPPLIKRTYIHTCVLHNDGWNDAEVIGLSRDY